MLIDMISRLVYLNQHATKIQNWRCGSLVPYWYSRTERRKIFMKLITNGQSGQKRS